MIRGLYWSDGGIRELGPGEIPALASNETLPGVLWVDVEAEPAEPTRELLEKEFGFHYLAVDDCLNVRVDMPKLDDYGDYLFIVAQRLAYDTANDELHPAEI